jgi:hypothetical protein
VPSILYEQISFARNADISLPLATASRVFIFTPIIMDGDVVVTPFGEGWAEKQSREARMTSGAPDLT